MKQVSIQKLLKGAALIIFLIVLGWAYYLSGSPSFNRLVAADEERRSDFDSLKRQIAYFAKEKKRLPDSLSELENGIKTWRHFSMKDPITHKTYKYRTINRNSYELCIEFSLTYAELSSVYKNKYSSELNHTKGENCYVEDQAF